MRTQWRDERDDDTLAEARAAYFLRLDELKLRYCQSTDVSLATLIPLLAVGEHAELNNLMRKARYAVLWPLE